MTVLEDVSPDTMIFHQTHKRIWPAAQRDSLFWSHIRQGLSQQLQADIFIFMDRTSGTVRLYRPGPTRTPKTLQTYHLQWDRNIIHSLKMFAIISTVASRVLRRNFSWDVSLPQLYCTVYICTFLPPSL